MPELLFLLLLAVAAMVLAINRARLWSWAMLAAAAAFLWQSELILGRYEPLELDLLAILGWLPALLLAALAVTPLRRMLLVAPAFSALRSVMPKVSDTETQALEAGTVGFDAELFSGTPDWAKLRAVAPITLTPDEQAFLDGPTEELCAMIDDWQVRHNQKEIPEAVWTFVRTHGFLGMLISKAHGGLGFSAQAQSLILGKIASRSPDVVTIVMVPNSLGPGELIEKYGTDEQKHHWLPRLARGDEFHASH